MLGKYLTRAAAVYFGLYGNYLEEAFYPETTFDALFTKSRGCEPDFCSSVTINEQNYQSIKIHLEGIG